MNLPMTAWGLRRPKHLAGCGGAARVKGPVAVSGISRTLRLGGSNRPTRDRPPISQKKPRTARPQVTTDTVGITLRPSRELLVRYRNAAAERTKKEGRVVSAQEIMLEVLEHGRPQVQP
jgi:hypothetical protein